MREPPTRKTSLDCCEVAACSSTLIPQYLRLLLCSQFSTVPWCVVPCCVQVFSGGKHPGGCTADQARLVSGDRCGLAAWSGGSPACRHSLGRGYSLHLRAPDCNFLHHEGKGTYLPELLIALRTAKYYLRPSGLFKTGPGNASMREANNSYATCCIRVLSVFRSERRRLFSSRLQPVRTGIFALAMASTGGDEGFHRRFGYDVQWSGSITSGNGESSPCTIVLKCCSCVAFLAATAMLWLCELDRVLHVRDLFWSPFRDLLLSVLSRMAPPWNRRSSP